MIHIVYANGNPVQYQALLDVIKHIYIIDGKLTETFQGGGAFVTLKTPKGHFERAEINSAVRTWPDGDILIIVGYPQRLCGSGDDSTMVETVWVVAHDYDTEYLPLVFATEQAASDFVAKTPGLDLSVYSTEVKE